jgi:multidrug efflux system membrane fusion protein
MAAEAKGMQSARRSGIGASVAALAAAAAFAYFRFDRRAPPALGPPPPIPVIATKAERRNVPIVMTGLGTVTPLNTATVRSQIIGLITSVDFKEGQFVRKGDRLAQIDPRTYQAALDQADATLAHDQVHLKNAQENLERYTGLAKQNSIALQQVADQQAAVEELVAQLRSDQGAIENAKAQLSYTDLVAPFDGVTGFRLLDVGNIIYPPRSSASADQNALVVVTQLQPISVVFTLPTNDLPKVQDAMAKGPLQAIAFSQDDKAKLDTGALAVVNNQANPDSGTVQLKAEFPNPKRALWPGSFVNVRLILSTIENGLTIPLDAVQQGTQGQVVYVVGPDQRVTIRSVTLRQSLLGQALVDKGLNEGETVVVRGQYRLTPGAIVTLEDADDPGAVPNPTTGGAGMLP